MADKKYYVHITDRCFITLQKHTEFIANANINAAKNFKNEFMETVNELEFFPERNISVRLQIDPGLIYHRALIGKFHAILYEIQGNDVYVDLVIDLRQNIKMSLL
jgi:hypothetical protein